MVDIAIRDQQTGRVSVLPEEQAAVLLRDSGELTGSTYEPVPQAEQDALARRAYAESGIGMAETATRGAVDWAGRPFIGAAGALMGAEGPLPSLSSIVEGGARELAGATPLQAGQTIAQSADVGRSLETINPGIYGGAEMLGQVGAALATGGASLGEGMAASAGSRLTSAGLGTVGRIVGSKVGQAATQGALEGAVDVVGRQLMADPQSSAENILAGAGIGALVGGLGGAVPVAVVTGGGKLVRGTVGLGRKAAGQVGEAVQALRPKVAGQLSAGLSEGGITASARSMLLDTQAYATGVDRQILEEVGVGGHLSAQAERAAATIADTVDEASQRLGETITRASRDLEATTDTSRIVSRKLDSLRRQTPDDVLLDPSRIGAAQRLADQSTAAMDKLAAELDAAVEAGALGQSAVRSFRTAHRELSQALEKQAEGGDLMDHVAPLELFKRRAQRATLDIRSSAENAAANAKLTSQELRSVRDFADRLDSIQEEVRGSLEDSRLVGDAFSSAQKQVNEAWSKGGIDALSRFRVEFMRPIGGQRDWASGRQLWEIDPSRLKRALLSEGKAEGALSGKALTAYMESVPRLAKAHAENYGDDLGAEYAARALGIVDSLKGASDDIAGVRAQRVLADKWSSLKEAEGQGAVLGPGAAVLGGITGGIPGAILGGAVGAALSPARAASVANQLKSMAGRAGGGAGALRKWAASGATVAKRVATETSAAASEVARGVNAVSQPLATSAALQWYEGDNELSPGANFRKRLKYLEKLDPAELAAGLTRDGSVPQVVADAIAAKSAEVRAYLLERLPTAAAGGAIRPGVPYVPSKAEMDAWGELAAAALRPQSVLSDIQSGVASHSQVQAVADLYPSVYQGWRSAAMAGLAQADSDGIPVPVAARQRLSLLLDLDGAGDVTMTAAFGSQLGAAISATRQAAAENSARAPQGSLPGRQAQTPAMELFGA